MYGSNLKFYRAAIEGPSLLGFGVNDKQVIAVHEPCEMIVDLGKNASNRKF